MSIGKTQLIDFMRRLLASDDTVRDVAADEVTDISAGLTKSEAQCLSVALVVAYQRSDYEHNNRKNEE